ncbi:conserved hypothetical protein [Crenothrix polyspora]|uniref:Uncharacterized protein n=1 Tax=Crenothrix polyspora TaxID=360316 RepID=A0A1R4H3S1_9GAMM|nr:hypothetical protein [Crenothrix polyspora]SJM90903.1 conserved hypothetical protein [Crenothrix polyspora]
MKFEAGDDIDSNHCIVLVHEFFRCEESFKEFALLGETMITQGRNRELSCKTYNAYARFIHHLYEFMLGCIAREVKNTDVNGFMKDCIREAKKVKDVKIDHTKLLDNYVHSHTQRILNKRRASIIEGTAPCWENHISYYPESVPHDFAPEFRKYRNKIIGHVAYERSSKLSLTEFYNKYHKYLGLIYHEGKYWRIRGSEFPDLNEITEFSLMIQSEGTEYDRTTDKL